MDKVGAPPSLHVPVSCASPRELATRWLLLLHGCVP
eukprot:COSAG01_NODE_68919_length_262_cov_17.202454_1_plen_35_part_10